MCSRVFSCIPEKPLAANEIKGQRAAGIVRFYDNTEQFQLSMLDTFGHSWNTTCCCLAAANPLTFSCVQMYSRYQVLNHVSPNSGWDNYICCQGYIPQCCFFAPGQCCESELPRTCAFLEACLFPGLAISSTRFVIMDQYNLTADPCDNRMIRVNNFIQLLACICDILAAFDKGFRDLAHLIDILADLVFLSIAGCQTAQVFYEMDYRTSGTTSGASTVYQTVAMTEMPPTAVASPLPAAAEAMKR
mmetsp:Transcript_12305/g.16607  ORF Transcript_12305/g.16607 Transcript_12305/m.16607 type:complete len:246 (-) Transcript_12305:331-1068(-)